MATHDKAAKQFIENIVSKSLQAIEAEGLGSMDTENLMSLQQMLAAQSGPQMCPCKKCSNQRLSGETFAYSFTYEAVFKKEAQAAMGFQPDHPHAAIMLMVNGALGLSYNRLVKEFGSHEKIPLGMLTAFTQMESAMMGFLKKAKLHTKGDR